MKVFKLLEINLIDQCILSTKLLGNRKRSWFANSETRIVSHKGLLVRLNIWLTLLYEVKQNLYNVAAVCSNFMQS